MLVNEFSDDGINTRVSVLGLKSCAVFYHNFVILDFVDCGEHISVEIVQRIKPVTRGFVVISSFSYGVVACEPVDGGYLGQT